MSRKICPICGTPAHPQARTCNVCGALLTEVPTTSHNVEESSVADTPDYDFHFGETDLAENQLRWRGGTYILAGMFVLVALACTGVLILGALRLFAFTDLLGGSPTNSQIVTASAPGILTGDAPNPFSTNTSIPPVTLNLPTVTADAPPTQTQTSTPAPTATPGPCMQQVQPGDSLIAIVSRCGHRDLAIIDVVLEINNLDAPELIQSGQTLEIPWPTPTLDADLDAVATVAGESAANNNDNAVIIAPDDGGIQIAFVVPTETLQPGVRWHTVVKDENIIVIAFNYGANVKILSELNPEITFSQCDFGEPAGGESCVVNVYEGQRIRVPAPTLTPTLSPTPSGSETPTPTATATFNAPSAKSPDNRALFQRQDIVTLRWTASGTLGANQVYLVAVEDLTVDVIFSAQTTEQLFIIPEAWQGQDDQRHEYSWSVSVIDEAQPGEPYFTTEARTFSWEGAGA